MKICQNCFADEILKSQVITAGKKSNCDVCCIRDDFTYDTETDDYLIDFFIPFISIFSPIHKIANSQPGQGTLLKTEVTNNWNIFATQNEVEVYQMLSEICKDFFERNPEILTSTVAVEKMYDSEYVQEFSLIRGSWQDFVEDITYNNRCHSDKFNKKIFEKYCKSLLKVYQEEKIFYRCRILEGEIGFDKGGIGAPPRGKTADGRANARGIIILYLGDSEKTTIHETRAGLHDYVCIGKFKLNESIRIIDFKKINEISPFEDGIIDDIAELAINKRPLQQIGSEMGKAMRKSDDVLDYLPTQYISDFVRSIVSEEKPNEYAYQGIEFRSVMNPGGYNLAIFSPDYFDIMDDLETKKINHISYEFT